MRGMFPCCGGKLGLSGEVDLWLKLFPDVRQAFANVYDWAEGGW